MVGIIMSKFKKAHVKKTVRVVYLRKNPDDPAEEEITVGCKKCGGVIEVDPTDRVYTWGGYEFCRTRHPDGYVRLDAITL